MVRDPRPNLRKDELPVRVTLINKIRAKNGADLWAGIMALAVVPALLLSWMGITEGLLMNSALVIVGLGFAAEVALVSVYTADKARRKDDRTELG